MRRIAQNRKTEGKTIKGKGGKPKVTETQIKNNLKRYLKIKGWFHYHNLQGLGCYKGIPDIIAMRKGRIVFIEAKRPGGVQSEHQITFQAQVEAEGFEYLIAKSTEDLERAGL